MKPNKGKPQAKKQPVKGQPQAKKAPAGDFTTRFKDPRILVALAVFVPAIGIIAFYNSLYKNSYNFPFYDDFNSILEFMGFFLSADSLREKIRLLFALHSEHRLVFDRVIALMEYYFFGEVNFKSFIMIGHVAVLTAVIMLYRSFQLKSKMHIIYLLPIALIAFNFRYFETSFWPMAALQNLWVLAFALSSLYYLEKNTRYSIYISILLGWVATFTSANGMMTFVAGGFVLLLNKNLLKKDKLIWLGAGIVSFAAYFYHYVKPGYHPEIIKPLMDNPMGFLGYALAFLGGVFTEDTTTAIWIGIGLVACMLFLTWKKYYAENPIIYGFMVFILITSVLAALTRFGFGLAQSLSSKYTISSALMVACCYIAMVPYLYRRMKLVVLVAATALAFYFHFGTYDKYLPAKKAEKEEFEKNYALVTAGKLSYFNFGWPPMDDRKEMPRRLLKMADSLGIFKFKFREEKDILNDLPTITDKEIKYKLERFEQAQPGALVMSGWAFAKNVDPEKVMTVLCYKDEQGNPVKYFVCQKYARQDVTQANAADNTNYNMSGFFTFFNPKEVKPGKYMLAIIIAGPDFKAELNTGQILNMQ